jgi:hypothetical protein
MIRRVLIGLVIAAGLADAQQPSPTVTHQSLDSAWWTGPLLAPSGATLPQGHFLIEPYLFDVITAHSHTFGTLTYALYGIADRFTAGLIPTASYSVPSVGPSSSGVGLGDLTVTGQYRLTLFHPDSWVPTASVVLEETLPTGKYDQLGDRPADGVGAGAFTTTLGLYSQTYFWMPNGRILRARLDLTHAFSSTASVQDVSVYGTGAGFSGHAQPGNSFYVDAAVEYSLTRSWVLALDVPFRHNGNTVVTGSTVSDSSGMQNPTSIRLNTGTSDIFGFAPAIEYSWTPKIGVILGVRVLSGRNTTTSTTPAVAINIVL